jgi:hypothetical protein
MSYTTRSFVVLTSGELALIGGQTLLNVMQSREACKHNVGEELRIIQVMLVKKGRNASKPVMTGLFLFKYKMQPDGFVDEGDVLRHIRYEQDALSRLARISKGEQDAGEQEEVGINEWTWTPTAAQFEECNRRLGFTV